MESLTTTQLVALLAFGGVLLLQWTEQGGASDQVARGSFLEHYFEVVSALGTVGLSTGVTPALSAAGKSVIMGCMFVGRLGPLIVADSLIGRRKSSPYTLPEEAIMVG